MLPRRLQTLSPQSDLRLIVSNHHEDLLAFSRRRAWESGEARSSTWGSLQSGRLEDLLLDLLSSRLCVSKSIFQRSRPFKTTSHSTRNSTYRVSSLHFKDEFQSESYQTRRASSALLDASHQSRRRLFRGRTM